MPHPRPITYKDCDTCKKLQSEGLPHPIVGSFIPQKTLNHIISAPFHNWYFFTLGYSPKFVEYVINKKKIRRNQIILDPFLGSGTTSVEAKLHGISSIGIDANDFMVFASKVKTNWDLDVPRLQKIQVSLIEKAEREISTIPSFSDQKVLGYFLNDQCVSEKPELTEEIKDLVERRYISIRPLEKVLVILTKIEKLETSDERNFFKLALLSILVPVSNVRYGPGFGIGPIKKDVDVIRLFREKTIRMIQDLKTVDKKRIDTPTSIELGDSRNLSGAIKDESIDHMITSPPYPGDHEYTRHTRLELVLSGLAVSNLEFREIKKRMVRCSTRSVYSTDDETRRIKDTPTIARIMDDINRRVSETNGTSGFEKLYSKVVGEYFGGMNRFLQELWRVSTEGGTAAFLVGDSHAFKMVHIETAKILGELALNAGFSSFDVELWWNKRSTSHSFLLPEYILNLRK